MTQPLAILLYENAMPGSQLIARFQDLGYRVQTLSDSRLLQEVACQEKPMVIVADLFSQHTNVGIEIKGLKHNPETNHIPVIAFAERLTPELEAAAQNAGATLVVASVAVLAHLPQLLDQALQVD